MIWVISSRSLRSAQARTANGICDKRVPSLASPSLGHYATLSLVVIGRGPENYGLRIDIRCQVSGFRTQKKLIAESSQSLKSLKSWTG